LTGLPEEWVRLSSIYFFHQKKNIGWGRMSMEKSANTEIKGRYDLTIFDKKGEPLILVECKSPEVSLHIDHWLQLQRYNLVMQAPYLFWTNGTSSWIFDVKNNEFIQSIDLVL